VDFNAAPRPVIWLSTTLENTSVQINLWFRSQVSLVDEQLPIVWRAQTQQYLEVERFCRCAHRHDRLHHEEQPLGQPALSQRLDQIDLGGTLLERRRALAQCDEQRIAAAFRSATRAVCVGEGVQGPFTLSALDYADRSPDLARSRIDMKRCGVQRHDEFKAARDCIVERHVRQHAHEFVTAAAPDLHLGAETLDEARSEMPQYFVALPADCMLDAATVQEAGEGVVLG
jgi:hypothetical protein